MKRTLFNMEIIYSYPVSNCVVVFLRLVTSARIRTDPNTYSPFLFNPETGEDIEPREFCERYVEAVGKEAGKFNQLLYHCFSYISYRSCANNRPHPSLKHESRSRISGR